MATAYLPLDVGSPDRFTCGLSLQGGGVVALFNDSTDESWEKKFPMPGNYASGLVVRYGYSMASANTSDKVDLEFSLWAVSDGDSADCDTANYDTANSSNPTVPDDAGYPDVQPVTMTNADSVAANDICLLKINRDADDATNDTAAGDMELRTLILEYTTA